MLPLLLLPRLLVFVLERAGRTTMLSAPLLLLSLVLLGLLLLLGLLGERLWFPVGPHWPLLTPTAGFTAACTKKMGVFAPGT
jgi:hypothetical protein